MEPNRVILVTLKPGAAQDDEIEIVDWLNEYLRAFKIPASIYTGVSVPAANGDGLPELTRHTREKIVHAALAVLQNQVTPDTVCLSSALLEQGCTADFIYILAGANLENLQEARELALEELLRLT